MKAHNLIPFTFLSFGVWAPSASAQFSTAINYSTPQQPGDAALADLDNDGDLDAAVTTDLPDKVSILANAGDGTFALVTSVILPPNASAQEVVLEDFDGDGDRDMAIALENQDSVILAFNGGALSFTLGGMIPAGIGPRSLAAGDLDNDMDMDLVVGNRDGNSVTVLLNNAGTLSSNGTIPTGADVRDVLIADFNSDGFLDIVASCHDDLRLDLLLGTGGGNFAAPVALPLGSGLKSEGLAAGDFDGDSDMDLAAATSNAPLHFASVFTNNAGTLVGPVNYAVGGIDPAGLHAADFDGSGSIDLVSANTDSSNMSFLPNTGGVFGAPTTFAAGLAPDRITGGDMDGNGSPDVMVVNRDSNDVSVFLSDSAVFDTFCFGDGGNQMGCTDCPCGNNAAVGTQGGCLNSAGTSASLIGSGSPSVAMDSTRFEMTGGTAATFALLSSGAAQAPANAMNPCFGLNSGLQSGSFDGLRCVVQDFQRHGARQTNANGDIGLTNAGWGPTDGPPGGIIAFFGFTAGQTRHFQAIYRDLPEMNCMTGLNTSQGVSVTFQP